MKNLSISVLVAALAICFGQFAHSQGNPEANKLAREGSQASKDQDWNKAINLLKKASDMDHKYAPNLAAAYQQRAFSEANDQRFQDAVLDLEAALKVNPKDARIYEQRAAVEVKINDYDKAIADYLEAIKLSPNEIRNYLYRGYIYEIRGDITNSMADTEKALKIQPKNPEALARKQRLQKIQQSNALPSTTPVAAPPRPQNAPPKKP
jgi:tetratricopeptide (TPR) repeat protein